MLKTIYSADTLLYIFILVKKRSLSSKTADRNQNLSWWVQSLRPGLSAGSACPRGLYGAVLHSWGRPAVPAAGSELWWAPPAQPTLWRETGFRLHLPLVLTVNFTESHMYTHTDKHAHTHTLPSELQSVSMFVCLSAFSLSSNRILPLLEHNVITWKWVTVWPLWSTLQHTGWQYCTSSNSSLPVATKQQNN